jgi:ATP-dependent helicase/nuclease subunit A
MNKNVLIDEAARQAIIRELDSCFLVEAGAGSGKTSSLVQRMTALIKEGICQVDTIAAITFTRKAAAELNIFDHDIANFQTQSIHLFTLS